MKNNTLTRYSKRIFDPMRDTGLYIIKDYLIDSSILIYVNRGHGKLPPMENFSPWKIFPLEGTLPWGGNLMLG